MHVRPASDGSMTNASGAAEIVGLSFAGFATIDTDAASCKKICESLQPDVHSII